MSAAAPAAATAEDGVLPDEALEVGVVGRPHGLGGELRVFPSSERPERLVVLRRLWLRSVRGGAVEVRACTVSSARTHGRLALLRLEGIDSREEAEAWVHATAWALPGDLPPWGPDEFGASEVIGATLLDGEVEVGTVSGLEAISGRDYFQVDRDGREVLVPAVKDWLVGFDRVAGRIVMRLPEGLVDP